MPRPSLGLLEYRRLGESKGLTYWGPALVPEHITVSVEWECNFCHRKSTKSYKSLKKAKFGCPCQSDATFSEERYYELAEKFDITYLPDPGKVPYNVYTPVLWRSKYGRNVVETSYASIAYGLTRSLRFNLELDY